jgi:hypothetical protein
MPETLIQAYLSQLDGIVRVVVGPGLATVVPSFDTVNVMMIPGVAACEMIAKTQDREIARETPPPDKGIRLKPPFDKASGVDRVQFTCPIRGFDIISTTWLGDIQVKDKGFRLRRRDAPPG